MLSKKTEIPTVPNLGITKTVGNMKWGGPLGDKEGGGGGTHPHKLWNLPVVLFKYILIQKTFDYFLDP